MLDIDISSPGSWLGAASGSMGLGTIGAAFGMLGGMYSNESSKAMTREQMRFQERMSGTVHRREVEDLRLAGLNPMLSAKGGASSPGGASPSIQNPTAGIPNMVTSAIAANRAKEELENLKQDTYKKQAESISADENAAFLREKTKNEKAARDVITANAKAINYDLAGKKNEASLQEAGGELLKTLPYLGQAQSMTRGSAKAVSPIFKYIKNRMNKRKYKVLK